MQRRDFVLSTLGAAAAALVPLRPARAKPRLRILILGGTRFLGPHMRVRIGSRPHADVLQSRQDQSRRAARRRAHPGRPQRAARRPQGPLVGCGYRHFRLCAAPRAPERRAAPPAGAALPVHLDGVGVRELRVGQRRALPGRQAGGRIHREGGRRDLRSTQGAVRIRRDGGVRSRAHDRPTPGLIVGPDDNTDRFTYWPARAARGGQFAAPAVPGIRSRSSTCATSRHSRSRPSSARHGGVQSAVTARPVHDRDVVDASVTAARKIVDPQPPPQPVWLPADFLAAQKVAPWSDMPVWAPSVGDEAGFALVSAARALEAGLRIRPMGETVTDTLRWHLQRPAAEQEKLKAGLSPEREAEVLAAWHNSRSATAG